MKKCIAFLLAAGFGIAAGLTLSVFLQLTAVTDNTMLPAYPAGNHVLVSRQAYRGGRVPKCGDVVLFLCGMHTPTGENSVMMKRVVACGGDQVLITGGSVYVNSRALAEPYVFTEEVSGEMNAVTVPEGCVFVLGDNRAASTDSRSETVGMVEEEQILGKVIYTW